MKNVSVIYGKKGLTILKYQQIILFELYLYMKIRGLNFFIIINNVR